MSFNNLKDAVQAASGKVKDISGKAIDSSQPARDRLKTTTQMGVGKLMASPPAEKLRDISDTISAKRLEEKLIEYTEIYGEVLLALHSRMEDAEEKQRLMMDEIQSLRATVQELRNELVRAKKSC